MKVLTQWDSYICTYWPVWVSSLLFSSYFITIKVTDMLTNIPELEIIAAIAVVAVLLVMSCVQYSRFVEHKKKHKDDEYGTEKFAVVPYLVIPVFGAVVSVCLALFVTDYAVMKGWIDTVQWIAVVNAFIAVVIYALADNYLIGHLGQAVYYETIESKVADTVKSGAGSADIDEKVKEALQRILR